MIGSVNPKRIAAVLALGLLAAVGNGLSALALSGCVAAVLTALNLWEYEPLIGRLHDAAEGD